MARENLQLGTTVNTDGLGCFRGTEAAGCEHKPRVTGGGKNGSEIPGLTWVSTILRNVKLSLDGIYHAFAPHYAARYLAEFQYHFNRRHELAALTRRLLRALPRLTLMSFAQLRALPPAQGVSLQGGRRTAHRQRSMNRQATANGTRLQAILRASKAFRA